MRKSAMRVFGVLNLVFGVLGPSFFASEIWRESRIYGRQWPGSPSNIEWALFIVLCGLTLAMTIGLGYCGLRLLANDRRFLIPTCLILIGELMYFFATAASWAVIPGNSNLIGGFFTTTDWPIAPQLVVGYPAWGLIGTFMLLVRKPRPPISPHFSTPR
jgi:hypothetical protein